MKLTGINLNLLNALNALLKEQSVTNAARILKVSQPQTSNMLKELRNIFSDDLLAKGPGNKLILTKKGKDLIVPVNEAIEKCRHVFSDEVAFNPENAVVNFRIGLNNYASNLIMPSLTKRISETTNQISLEIINANNLSDFELLYSENLDILIGFLDLHSQDVCSEKMFTCEFACLMAKQHPLARKNKLSKKDFLKYPYVQLKQTKHFWEQKAEIVIENSLKGKRNIVATFPHIFTVLETLTKGNYLSIIHKKIAEKYAERFDVKVIELPFDLPSPTYHIFWKKADDLNPENIWLRKMIKEVNKEL